MHDFLTMLRLECSAFRWPVCLVFLWPLAFYLPGLNPPDDGATIYTLQMVMFFSGMAFVPGAPWGNGIQKLRLSLPLPAWKSGLATATVAYLMMLEFVLALAPLYGRHGLAYFFFYTPLLLYCWTLAFAELPERRKVFPCLLLFLAAILPPSIHFMIPQTIFDQWTFFPFGTFLLANFLFLRERLAVGGRNLGGTVCLQLLLIASAWLCAYLLH